MSRHMSTTTEFATGPSAAGRYCRTTWIARVAMGLVMAATMTVGCSSSTHQLVGYQRSPLPQVGQLSLPAVEADGATTDFPFVAPARGLLLVYFGYTSCPDVCPTTMADLRRALDKLGSDSSRVELAMTTIDPQVDTPDVLSGYVRSFVGSAVALRTTDDARLRPVAQAFGADYGHELVDGTSSVFHTSSVYAVDPGGNVVLTWSFGTTWQDMAADLRQLLDRPT